MAAAAEITMVKTRMRMPSDSSRVNGKTLARSEQRKLTPMQPSTMRFCLPTGMMMARNMPNSITEQPLTAQTGMRFPISTPSTVPMLQPGMAAHMVPK